MNQRSLLPLAVALIAAFGGQLAHAQVAPRPADGSVRNVNPRLPSLTDGSSNTVSVGETAPNSLLTRASVSGNVTQTANQGTGGAVDQTLSVGGASRLTGANGNIRTQGTLVGDLVQSRTGSPVGGVAEAQTLSIGGVAGAVTAQTVDANGSVLTNISQLGNPSTRGQGAQTVDVGSVRNAAGGSLITQGLVTGTGVVQNSRNELSQVFAVGSIVSSSVQAASTNGLVSGQVNQSSGGIGSGESRSQTIGVGELQFVQAQFVNTNGVVSGALSQTQAGAGAASQAVRVGSVALVTGGGNINTQGTATGAVTQSANNGSQQLLVAAVIGGAPSNANAKALLTGSVTQSSNSFSSNEQRIAIGAIEEATGQVSTDAIVGAALSQSMSNGASSREQLISIASAQGTQGNVTTRAVVNGSVSQNSGASSLAANGMKQRIGIGSALDTGAMTVRTDVTVTGNLSQSAGAFASGTQSMLIGSVSGL